MPAAAPAHDQATTFQATFHGRTDQVSQVRRDIAAYLHNCPPPTTSSSSPAN